MEPVTTYDPNDLSVSKLHGLLLSSVAPRPIAFASTVDKAGRVNLSPFSFFNTFGANPPIMIFSPARRGRDNSTKDTYDNVLEVAEVVINIVNYNIVEQVSLASTEYEKGVNEFIKSGLTEVPSKIVAPPRVGQAPVSFECAVDQVIPLGREGGAGNLVICKVLLMHIQSRYLSETGHLDTTKLDLVGRMGGNWYARASGEALFEIPKPLITKGIGVDQLPSWVRETHILTGNHLGRLGNLEKLPDQREVDKWKNDPGIKDLLKNSEAMQDLCLKVREFLDEGKPVQALLTAMVAESLNPGRKK